MKRFTLIALAVLFIAALGAGSAFAETYQVTAGYGVRVIEQGACEQVGSITIEGQTNNDLFIADTTITVELLGGATICRNVGAAYTFGAPTVTPTALNTWDPTTTAPITAGADYYIEAVIGDDYFIIQILVQSGLGERVVVGHELESFICFNLQGTIYNASDPNLQLVQVSYRDSRENTYSGDSYVATVKPQTISFGPCDYNKYGPIIPYKYFCFDPDSPTQSVPDPDQCGYVYWSSACLFQFTDNSVGELDGTYTITIGKTAGAKAGIGFGNVAVYYDTGGYYVGVTEVERRNAANVVLTPAMFPSLSAMYAATSQITIQADLDGPGRYEVSADGYAHQGPGANCPFQSGPWIVDIFGSRIPCGHSFSMLDMLIMNTAECSYEAEMNPYCLLFPFGAGSWMNGLVLDNPNSHAQVFTAYVREADGDYYEAQGTIAAYSMAVDLVENIFTTITVSDSTDAAPFDEDYWLRVESDDDPFFGYMFIFDGTMANGYTPICCYPECYD